MIPSLFELARRTYVAFGCLRCAVQAMRGRPMSQVYMARPARPRVAERNGDA